MKLVRSNDKLELHLGPREMNHLLALIGLYPCVPPAHHTITRSIRGTGEKADSSQQLLDEALAEHREQHRKNLQAFIADPARCKKTNKGGVLCLTHIDAEWLLQVLNDVRVGSWIRLGSPETGIPEITPANTRDVWAMELAGYFEAALVEALGSGD